jgi:acetoin utilization deacetylase AcuC-like enzyme
MTPLIFTHPAMLEHRPPSGHVERSERLTAALGGLEAAGLTGEMREAARADVADLERVHPRAFIQQIAAEAPQTGYHFLDPDTALSPGSLEAAYRAAGAVTGAISSVLAGETTRAFCAVRPPGHHAGPDYAMGFCVFSNVAVGARLAQAQGLSRVAVVDFDVHHGNGTQGAFETDPGLMLASVHQSPHYPGTGDPSETGVGNIVNRTVAPMASRQVWRRTFDDLMTQVDAFAPELILVSAGFDAHARDPLSHQLLEAEDYDWATRAILSVARAHAKGRVVSSLEGGYDLQALGQSAAAHVSALSAL